MAILACLNLFKSIISIYKCVNIECFQVYSICLCDLYFSTNNGILNSKSPYNNCSELINTLFSLAYSQIRLKSNF